MQNILHTSCPIPPLESEIVLLGHGSGGLMTNELLDKGVFEILKNKYLDSRHDGAILPELTGPLAFTTDSFVVSPIFFPGGDIGSLAIHGTVNDLAMCGAKPLYLSLSFIIEEGLRMEDLWKVIWSIKLAADRAGVFIVTGDTKVVERGKGDQIFINTTGIGSPHPRATFSTERIKAGDLILVSGPIAQHGIAIMSVREGLAFESPIKSDTRALHRCVWTLLESFGQAVKIMRDPTRGGIASVLNEIARDARLGINLVENTLPVNPQVAGACEMLGLDPLYVANEGIFLAIIDRDIQLPLMEVLKSCPEASNACLIGEVTGDHPGQVILESNIGGRRVVQMLTGDQLPRIC